MLSEDQRTIIRSTVPLLEQGGEALIQHFYRMLLGEHPEVRALFNPAHQRSGDQPRALARAVLLYAKHIDHLEPLGPLVQQIVHKHVALQVQPEHYPIVGGCLLRSIREVLGAEVATDAVIEAWGAAYGQLAQLLIGAESSLYEARETAAGGWRGARRFVVARKEAESAEITSFYLEPEDRGALLAFEPGQYLGLRLSLDGQEVRRNYSLSAAANGAHYRISVKREQKGAVSNHLHDHVHVGSVLEVFPPTGDFTLQAGERPVALISGGVGITPTLAMLQHPLAHQPTRAVHFIHCARHAEAQAFAQDLLALRAAHPQLQLNFCVEEGGDESPERVRGRLDRDTLGRWLPQDRDVDAYFLGPQPFMAQIKRDLSALGVPQAQIRYEFFGPAGSLD